MPTCLFQPHLNLGKLSDAVTAISRSCFAALWSVLLKFMSPFCTCVYFFGPFCTRVYCSKWQRLDANTCFALNSYFGGNERYTLKITSCWWLAQQLCWSLYFALVWGSNWQFGVSADTLSYFIQLSLAVIWTPVYCSTWKRGMNVFSKAPLIGVVNVCGGCLVPWKLEN